MGNLITEKLAIQITLASFLSSLFVFGNEDESNLNLADAFTLPQLEQQASLEAQSEVEPVVVGRKKWNDKPAAEPSPESSSENAPSGANPVRIQELDPLETKQNQADGINMKITAPVIPPAVNLNRNFEGTLVLKPRTLGFEKNFPFQLENTKGRRLAFIDTENLKVIDPLDFKDKRVNILGKLEPIEDGKKDLVIRARLLRIID